MPPGVSTVWQCSVVGPSGSTPHRRTTGAAGSPHAVVAWAVVSRCGQPVAERVGHRQDDARAHRVGRVRGHLDGHRDRAAAEGHDAGDGGDQEQSSADPGHRVTVTRGRAEPLPCPGDRRHPRTVRRPPRRRAVRGRAPRPHLPAPAAGRRHARPARRRRRGRGRAGRPVRRHHGRAGRGPALPPGVVLGRGRRSTGRRAEPGRRRRDGCAAHEPRRRPGHPGATCPCRGSRVWRAGWPPSARRSGWASSAETCPVGRPSSSPSPRTGTSTGARRCCDRARGPGTSSRTPVWPGGPRPGSRCWRRAVAELDRALVDAHLRPVVAAGGRAGRRAARVPPRCSTCPTGCCATRAGSRARAGCGSTWTPTRSPRTGTGSRAVATAARRRGASAGSSTAARTTACWRRSRPGRRAAGAVPGRRSRAREGARGPVDGVPAPAPFGVGPLRGAEAQPRRYRTSRRLSPPMSSYRSTPSAWKPCRR